MKKQSEQIDFDDFTAFKSSVMVIWTQKQKEQQTAKKKKPKAQQKNVRVGGDRSAFEDYGQSYDQEDYDFI